jgi:hypothetical protein
MSLIEAWTNAGIGLLVSWLFTFYCLPLFGYQPSAQTALWITLIYFFLSMSRTYLLRRLFTWHER